MTHGDMAFCSFFISLLGFAFLLVILWRQAATDRDYWRKQSERYQDRYYDVIGVNKGEERWEIDEEDLKEILLEEAEEIEDDDPADWWKSDKNSQED